MKLEVHERLAILQILPTTGDYASLKTLRRAREMLSFTAKEVKFYKITSGIGPDGEPQTLWDPQKAKEQVKDIPVDEFTTNLVKKSLAELEGKQALNEQTISLYEKFIVAYQ